MVPKTLRIKAQTSEKCCRGYCCIHKKRVILILINRQGWNVEPLKIHHFLYLGHKDQQNPVRPLVGSKWYQACQGYILKHRQTSMGEHKITTFVLRSKPYVLLQTQRPAFPDSVFLIMHQTGFLLTRCGLFQLDCLNHTQDFSSGGSGLVR